MEESSPEMSSDERTLPLLDKVRDVVRTRHYSLKTAMIYTHVFNEGVKGVFSPADRL